jgi:hypothetical protein
VFGLALHDDGELVTTQPRDGVSGAHTGVDAFGDQHQQGVACEVAQSTTAMAVAMPASHPIRPIRRC